MLFTVVLLFGGVFNVAFNVAALSVYQITDAAGIGRTFDGIGGLSGGGATSKLLVNYDDPHRNKILDYLFLPQYGASLQILKVEIGGDDQSSDGSESSHMHEEWDENYNRGYEWWLMKEAKKRNSKIKLYGLPWSWPGWLGTSNPYQNVTKTAQYILKWIQGAKRVHGLDIDYIGIWNEKECYKHYLVTLRQLLDLKGFKNLKIIAPDGGWGDDIVHASQANNATFALGAHYPGTFASEVAKSSGKRLWSSEDYSTFNDDKGGGCWARILNQNYVNGYMTSTIAWNLIASYYPDMAWYNEGLMTAMEPWSGHYEIKSPIWVSAHTTQFTQIGWSYLKHGAGVGKLAKGGSYVTFTDPTRKQLTLVIETMTHNHSQCIRPALPSYTVEKQKAVFAFGASFANITRLYFRKTNLKFDGTQSLYFQKQTTLQVHGAAIALDLDVDSVYTITTISTGRHPDPGSIPAHRPFPLPYTDNFESYNQDEEPFLLSQQSGALEVQAESYRSKTNKFVRQMTLRQPVPWCTPASTHDYRFPIAVIGNPDWKKIEISVQMRFPNTNSSDAFGLLVRTLFPSCRPQDSTGVFFWVHRNSKSYSFSIDAYNLNIFSAGNLKGMKISNGTWHNVSLGVSDNKATAMVNEEKIGPVTLPKLARRNGFVGFVVNKFASVDVDNLCID